MNIWRFHTWDVTGTKNVREKCNWVHKRDLELEILCVWVTERKREIERVKEMPPFLSSKWISKWQELWTVIDGIPGWPKKKKKRKATLCNVPESSLKHTQSILSRQMPASRKDTTLIPVQLWWHHIQSAQQGATDGLCHLLSATGAF